jgi:predicted nucleotidyltransferase
MTAKQRNKYYQEGLNEIVKAIKKYDPEKIILFGSVAYGKFHEDSDIDLLVIKDTDEPYNSRQLRVARMYCGLVPTDIIVVTQKELDKAITENRFFVVEEILKKGKVIYERH